MTLDYRSPLAKVQKQASVQNILTWVDSLKSMGTEAAATIDMKQTAKFLGETLGVPNNLITREILTPEIISNEVIPALEGELNVSDIVE